jgi:hypothetical protein
LFVGEPTGYWGGILKGSWTPVLLAGEGLNMTLFYRRTNRLLERSLEWILDSSSTGWRRSNMTLFYWRTNRLLERSMEGILDSSSTGWRKSNMTCL